MTILQSYRLQFLPPYDFGTHDHFQWAKFGLNRTFNYFEHLPTNFGSQSQILTKFDQIKQLLQCHANLDNL